MTINISVLQKQLSISLLPYILTFAALILPFSIAISNMLFGLCLLIAIVSGSLWSGMLQAWEKARTLCIILLAYLLLMLLGLLWSLDIHRGVIIVSKQWSWLLLPLVIATLNNQALLNRFLLSLSLGLGLHLLLCISQALGFPLPVQAPGGSSSDDPTGLIGHISFGFIYGIWGAWLIQWGAQRHDIWRYLAWIVSALSFVMIFNAQGRSGYLVAFAALAFMLWKLWFKQLRWRQLLTITIVLTAIAAGVIAGSAKERLQWTADSITAVYQGDFQNAEARWSLWYAAWKGWQQSPLFGTGTGSYPTVAMKIAESKPELKFGGINPSHPHQMYLLDLLRWGPTGLLLLLMLLWQWFKLDNRPDWSTDYYSSLTALSAIGLAVHGLSAPSLEEYYSSVYGTIFLGLGLAAIKQNAPCAVASK